MSFRATPLPPSPHTADEARSTVRRRRQIRVVIAAAAVVLIAAIPAAANALTGRPPHRPAPAASSILTTEPSATETVSPSTGASPTAQPTSASSTPPSTPTAPTVDAHSAGSSDWLPADQYPLAGSYHWTLSQVTNGIHEAQSSYACQTHNLRDLGMLRLQTRIVEHGGQFNPDGYQGGETLFFFDYSGAASDAYHAMVQDLANCQARETADAAHRSPAPHVALTQTGSIGSGSAWSRIVSARVYVDDNLEDHTLIVQRGSVVAVVNLYWNQGPHPTYDPSGDTAILRLMAAELCQYDRSC